MDTLIAQDWTSMSAMDKREIVKRAITQLSGACDRAVHTYNAMHNPEPYRIRKEALFAARTDLKSALTAIEAFPEHLKGLQADLANGVALRKSRKFSIAENSLTRLQTGLNVRIWSEECQNFLKQYKKVQVEAAWHKSLGELTTRRIDIVQYKEQTLKHERNLDLLEDSRESAKMATHFAASVRHFRSTVLAEVLAAWKQAMVDFREAVYGINDYNNKVTNYQNQLSGPFDRAEITSWTEWHATPVDEWRKTRSKAALNDWHKALGDLCTHRITMHQYQDKAVAQRLSLARDLTSAEIFEHGKLMAEAIADWQRQL